MRKIIVLSFVTLDGVMQAPGGPDEDRSGGFAHGGWMVPYADDLLDRVMVEQMGRPYDLLLGRKTYEIFAGYWPKKTSESDPIAAGLNRATKYVATRTLEKADWEPVKLLRGDVAAEIRRLKETDGPDLQVHGSGALIQTLLANDLVDQLWLKTFPLTLGGGKRLFAQGTIPASFNLLESKLSPSGVQIANYARAGEVRTGSFD
jgi:dihydrofolate reductase